MTLDKLELNKTSKITKLNCIGNIRRRMLDLGIIKDTSITPILKSPSGNLVAYEVRGTIIAIRKEDSCKIEVLNI